MEHGEACKTFFTRKLLTEPLIYRFKISSIAGNTYFICADDEVLVIDPPLRSRQECEAFIHALNTLCQKDAVQKLFFTHAHETDFSLIPQYFSEDTIIYIGQYEKLPTLLHNPLQYQNTRYCHEGYPKALLDEWDARTEVPLMPDECVKFVYLGDRECISVGNVQLCCIHTPGHTSGHMCLWLETQKILFSGDSFLYEMLPCVGMWDENDNEIEIMLKSLDKLKQYPAAKVLPAHGSVGENYIKRLEEIERQYYIRILHMYRLVYDYPGRSAYELCQYFYQNSDNWKDAIPQKKWHAMEDTLSFLNYLRNKNYVAIKKGKNGIVNFPGKNKLTDF